MNTFAKAQSDTRFSVEEYLAFIATRPSEERWQLIDGVAMMMTPPTIRHQDIAFNLACELRAHIRGSKLPYKAMHEVGLIVPGVELFRPQADVAVVAPRVDPEASWADQFYLVAEVLSDSNGDAEVDIKRQRYQLHTDNQYCLIISQKVVKVDLYSRATNWEVNTIEGLDNVLSLPFFGFCCSPLAIYADTPLARD
jgi:Uma2 family endonuclease